MDETDLLIMQVLAHDGRTTLKDLARRVNLSSPSAAERLRRLEERGAILGYRAEVHPGALGFGLQAIIRVRPLPGRTQQVQSALEAIEEVTECDKVTGDDCFVVRLYLRSIGDLDTLMQSVTELAETSTALVKSQPIRRRPPPMRAEPSRW